MPDKSGVYLMKDAAGEVIYVGKAKVLKNRVRSYFNGAHSGKVLAMVFNISSIDWVVTKDENEAFALEINLIKQLAPKYNIMLRDDKHYPYIRIDVKSDYPRIIIVRKVKKDGAKYFGPYFDATSMRKMLDTLKKVFPIRSCNKNINTIKGKDRPCLNYHINRCIAPCKADVTIKEYKKIIDSACSFLAGMDKTVEDVLTKQMITASKRLDFEAAAIYRDRLAAVKTAMSQHQRAIHGNLESYDIIGIAQKDTKALAYIMIIRNGKIIGSEGFHLQMPSGGDYDEIISHFIKTYYHDANTVPLNIIISHKLNETDSIETYLSKIRQSPVHIKQVTRGEKKALLDMAISNANEELKRSFEQEKRNWDRTGGAVDDLQRLLKLEKRPYRIEAYDISNIQGVDSVASMVVFINGVSSRKDYRRFKIKTVDGANDFASMAEVISRRFKRGLDEKKDNEHISKFAQFPDLVLIDGGKGQLSAARKVMEDLGVDEIATIGLAKREEEVFFPKTSLPILIDKGSPALHLLQRLRNESHRFAISYHRSLRKKGTLKSDLDNIEGIGPARRKSLLTTFPTISAIKLASFDELMKAPSMNKNAAKAVYDYYQT